MGWPLKVRRAVFRIGVKAAAMSHPFKARLGGRSSDGFIPSYLFIIDWLVVGSSEGGAKRRTERVIYKTQCQALNLLKLKDFGLVWRPQKSKNCYFLNSNKSLSHKKNSKENVIPLLRVRLL